MAIPYRICPRASKGQTDIRARNAHYPTNAPGPPVKAAIFLMTCGVPIQLRGDGPTLLAQGSAVRIMVKGILLFPFSPAPNSP